MNEEQAEAMLYYANNSVEQQMPEVSDEAVLFCNKLSKITNDDRRYQPPYLVSFFLILAFIICGQSQQA